MRSTIVTALVLAVLVGPVSAQQTPDREAVRRAALDYIEGFYEGDSAKLVRSVRPDVRKAGYYKARDAATYAAEEMPFADIIAYANNFKRNGRTTPATAPRSPNTAANG